jgi:hypothetical protein
VYVGNVSAAALDLGATGVTPQGVSQLCQAYTRTPTGEIELRWKPASGDWRWKDSTAALASADKDTRAAMLLVFGGLPAGVGLHIRFTAIYEWQPRIDRGIAPSGESLAHSRNNIAEVVTYVGDKVGWMSDAMGSFGRGIGQGLVNGVQGYFGGMPAFPITRNYQRIAM